MCGQLMSRVGKKPIVIPDGVKVEQQGLAIKVSGPLGNLQLERHHKIKVQIDNKAGQVVVINENPDSRMNKQLHGTMRALIANMVAGVSKGYVKKMEVYGTGYNVKEQNGKLVLQLGYANPVEKVIPKGIKVNIEVAAAKGEDTAAKFTLTGIDKCVLGQFASDIRKAMPPEPYKGKGVRYAGEHIRRKAGKAFTSGSGA